jgi:hypothetical protein
VNNEINKSGGFLNKLSNFELFKEDSVGCRYSGGNVCDRNGSVKFDLLQVTTAGF